MLWVFSPPADTGRPIEPIAYHVPLDAEMKWIMPILARWAAGAGGSFLLAGCLAFAFVLLSPSGALSVFLGMALFLFFLTALVLGLLLLILAVAAFFYPSFVYWHVPPTGYVALWKGRHYTRRFSTWPSDGADADDEPVMYYAEPFQLASYGIRPSVITKDGITLDMRIVAEIKIADLDLFHASTACSEHSTNELLWDWLPRSVLEQTQEKLKTLDYSVDLRARGFLDGLLGRGSVAAANERLASIGVRLLMLRIEDMVPPWEDEMNERKSTDAAVPEGAPVDESAVAVMRSQYGVGMPTLFDYEQIRRDAEKLSSVGLVGKYLHAVKRRFQGVAEREILRAVEQYYIQGGKTLEALYQLDRVEKRHQIFLEECSAKIKSHRADGVEHDARGAEAAARIVKTVPDVLRSIVEAQNLLRVLSGVPESRAPELTEDEEIDLLKAELDADNARYERAYEGQPVQLQRALRDREDEYRKDVNAIKERRRGRH